MTVHKMQVMGCAPRNQSFPLVISVGMFVSYAPAQKIFRTIHDNKSIYVLDSEGESVNIGVSFGDDGLLIVDDIF